MSRQMWSARWRFRQRLASSVLPPAIRANSRPETTGLTPSTLINWLPVAVTVSAI
ncbi:MAG TPA: hypothetical protein VJN19_11490 [Propionibacteriaceae bacterium]|nr:hypothetical protein [Propionibacteriaceae bacterium]